MTSRQYKFFQRKAYMKYLRRSISYYLTELINTQLLNGTPDNRPRLIGLSTNHQKTL